MKVPISRRGVAIRVWKYTIRAVCSRWQGRFAAVVRRNIGGTPCITPIILITACRKVQVVKMSVDAVPHTLLHVVILVPRRRVCIVSVRRAPDRHKIPTKVILPISASARFDPQHFTSIPAKRFDVVVRNLSVACPGFIEVFGVQFFPARSGSVQ